MMGPLIGDGTDDRHAVNFMGLSCGTSSTFIRRYGMKIKDIFQGEIIFRKTPDGQDVFYPWGFPGEAFLISPSRKIKIDIFLYVLTAVIFLAAMLLIIGNVMGYLDMMMFTKGAIIAIDAILALYLCFVLYMKKLAKLYVLPVEDRASKKISGMWMTVSVQFIFFWSALIFNLWGYAILSFLSTVLTYLFLKRLEKNKGVLLSKS